MPNLLDCSPLLNSFQQFISFVICFLVSRIFMEFKEWNLNMAVFYGGFNLITLFHFQYSTSDPIIFGYNFSDFYLFFCQINVVFRLMPYSSPSFFDMLSNLFWSAFHSFTFHLLLVIFVSQTTAQIYNCWKRNQAPIFIIQHVKRIKIKNLDKLINNNLTN